MSKTTTIYLGASDVVAHADTPESGSGWSTWSTAEIGDQTLHYSPDLIEALNDLAAREDVQFRWLTSWRRDAPALLCPAIGLEGEDWRLVADVAPSGSRKLSKSANEYWWKLDAFKADILTAPIKRLIWLDPEVEYHAEEVDNWMDPYGVLEDDRLYISPEGQGLTRHHLELIHEFLDS